MRYILVQFSEGSSSFPRQFAVQETDSSGQLVGIYDMDGELLLQPGGPKAVWSAIGNLNNDLDDDAFWRAVNSAESLITSAIHNII